MSDYLAALNTLVEPVRDMIVMKKDRSLPYVGLEHLESGASAVVALGRAEESVSTNIAFKPGDILFGKLRPNLRKSVLVDFHGYCSTEFIVLRPKAGIDPSYAGWIMRSQAIFAEAMRTAEGTRMPRTSWAGLKNFHVNCPSLKEQRRIAKILDAADQAIASTKSAIAKQRLVNFGLIDEILAKIDVPERPMAEFLTARPRNGFSPNETETWTGVVALGLGCLTVDGFAPRQLKNIPAKDGRYTEAWLADGDLLISRSNTYELVGLVGRYRDVGFPCVYPDLMMKLTPNNLVRPGFLELILRAPNIRQQIKRMSQGTSGSMVKISAGSLAGLPVKIPGLPAQDRVLSVFMAGTAHLDAREHEVAKLRLIKQGLMDDLLNGRA